MSIHTAAERAKITKNIARELGFDYCGISKSGFLDKEAPALEKWLKAGKHGDMKYLENNFEKRLNPSLLVDGARSVISLIYNYYPGQKNEPAENYKVAKYAWGEDYHFVVKRKLKIFLLKITEAIGNINGRAFVDSAPVMERQWAAKSGIGWIGKNTLLINPKMGSFFFLAELIVDIELEPDSPIKDYCGSCNKCIEACPTQALTPYNLDARKCISYLTIELKNEIPDTFQGKFNNWIFGCDICQDVCPWNRFSTPHQEPSFRPSPEFLSLKKEDWQRLDEYSFHKIFAKSPIKRAKLPGMKRNILFVSKQKT